MNHEILKNLRKCWHHNQLVQQQTIIEQNRFSGLGAIVTELYQVLLNSLSADETASCFEQVFADGSTAQSVLSEGDEYYVYLIRHGNILNEFNKEFEIINPLSRIIRDIIISIANENSSYQGYSSPVYSALENQIMSEVGKMFALGIHQQTLEQWSTIFSRFAYGRHDSLYQSWLIHLPSEAIAKEKVRIFADRPEKFEDMATFWGGGQNDITATNYLTFLDGLAGQTPVEYIRQATANMDMCFPKAQVVLAGELLYKLSLMDWLTYLDQLRLPILQDRFLLSICNLEDFSSLIALILSRTDLQTDKRFLIVLVLENYYAFVDRTLLELSGFKTSYIGSGDEYKVSILEDVDQVLTDWNQKLLPDTLKGIFASVINEESTYTVLLMTVFDWVSSHSKLYINRNVRSREGIIDCINEMFLDRLTTINYDAKLIVNSLAQAQINWHSLKILTELHDRSKDDLELLLSIFDLYLRFLDDPNFFYSGAGGNADQNVNIDYACDFARVINYFDNPYEKWSEIYVKFKMSYEGWLINRGDAAASYRETFLLTVGYCLGSFQYRDGLSDLGRQMTDAVSEILLMQTRLQGDRGSVDYDMPVTVCAITLSKYDPKYLDGLIFRFVAGLDSLELLLVFCAHADPEILGQNISAITRLNLLKRLDSDFWVLENRFKGKLHHVFDSYDGIRRQIQDFLK